MKGLAAKQSSNKCWVARCAVVTAICGLCIAPVLLLLMTARCWLPDAHCHWIKGEVPDVVYTLCAFGEYFLPPICGVSAIILAHIARHRINNTQAIAGHKTIKAAMIVGYVTIVLWFVFFHLSASY